MLNVKNIEQIAQLLTLRAEPEALAVALLKAKIVLLSRDCRPPANPTAILWGPCPRALSTRPAAGWARKDQNPRPR